MTDIDDTDNNINIEKDNIDLNVNVHNDKILIFDLINQLENLGEENNKEDFVKNYAKLKILIEKTDNVLYDDLELNNNNKLELNYNQLNIQELFKILESYNEYISNPEKLKKLDIEKLKMILKLIKILEEKIESDTLNIIESQ